MGLSGQKPRIGFCLSLGWFMFDCPRYCEIFGPGACVGVFDEKEASMRQALKDAGFTVRMEGSRAMSEAERADVAGARYA